jgi:hypothetical protein
VGVADGRGCAGVHCKPFWSGPHDSFLVHKTEAAVPFEFARIAKLKGYPETERHYSCEFLNF